MHYILLNCIILEHTILQHLIIIYYIAPLHIHKYVGTIFLCPGTYINICLPLCTNIYIHIQYILVYRYIYTFVNVYQVASNASLFMFNDVKFKTDVPRSKSQFFARIHTINIIKNQTIKTAAVCYWDLAQVKGPITEKFP